ncbi:hypothetical protein D3C76_346650 [compost metagenome]
MATIIDSLVVKLGLDTTDFKKGEKDLESGLDNTRKKTEKVGDDVAANGKKAAEFFGQLQKAALKFFAVLTVGRGMADFTRVIVSGGAQLDRMSTRLGTTADSLSRWQGAVRQSGGTGEGLLNTLQSLSNEMTQIAVTGESSLIPMLGFLGVSLKDSNGKAKTTVDLLKDIGDAANVKIPNAANRFNILQSMGIDEGTINLLMKGSAERDRLLSSQKGFSDADAKAAREASEKWEGVKLQIERTSQAIVIKMLPLIQQLTEAMLKFTDIAVPGLLKIGEVLGDLHDKTDGWSTALLGVLATLRIIGGAGMLSSLLGVSTVVAGLSGAAVVGAAAGGVVAGNAIHEKIQGTTVEDDIGEGIARVLAFFGNEEAQRALDINTKQPRRGTVGETYEGKVDRSGGASRAERNNNPGNLEFRGQAGAVPEDGSGRFAKFNSPSEGVTALAKQLQLYGKRGLDTINEIINKYAPASENNTKAYIDSLTKRLGVAPDEELDLSNPQTLSELIKGISRHESGSDFLSDKDVMTGINKAGVGGAQQPGNVSIGEVKVYTQATDASGIARDMRAAIIRQADTGVR